MKRYRATVLELGENPIGMLPDADKRRATGDKGRVILDYFTSLIKEDGQSGINHLKLPEDKNFRISTSETFNEMLDLALENMQNPARTGTSGHSAQEACVDYLFSTHMIIFTVFMDNTPRHRDRKSFKKLFCSVVACLATPGLKSSKKLKQQMEKTKSGATLLPYISVAGRKDHKYGPAIGVTIKRLKRGFALLSPSVHDIINTLIRPDKLEIIAGYWLAKTAELQPENKNMMEVPNEAEWLLHRAMKGGGPLDGHQRLVGSVLATQVKIVGIVALSTNVDIVTTVREHMKAKYADEVGIGFNANEEGSWDGIWKSVVATQACKVATTNPGESIHLDGYGDGYYFMQFSGTGTHMMHMTPDGTPEEADMDLDALNYFSGPALKEAMINMPFEKISPPSTAGHSLQASYSMMQPSASSEHFTMLQPGIYQAIPGTSVSKTKKA